MLPSRSLLRGRQRAIRRARIRARVWGTAARPRLSVFRSKKHLVLQLIDDASGRTLVSVHDGLLSSRARGKGKSTHVSRKVEVARALGALLAERAKKAGIARVIFDRGGYAYHGRVKAVADGARAGGLQF